MISSIPSAFTARPANANDLAVSRGLVSSGLLLPHRIKDSWVRDVPWVS